MPTHEEQVAGIGRRTYLTHLRDVRAFDRELAAILRDAAREADRILKFTLPEDAGLGARVRRAQAQQAALAIRRMQAEMYGTINQTLGNHIRRTTAGAIEGLMTINGLLGDALGPAMRDSFLAQSRFRLEHVRSRLINNIGLSDQVYKTQALSNRWVERTVNRGILMGKSAAEIATDVRGMIRPDTPGGVRYAASRLGRTELNNAFHKTSVRATQEQPWVVGNQWHVSGSHPRPDECDDFADFDEEGLGNGVYSPETTPDKPHPMCLCFTTPITIKKDEFVDNYFNGQYDDFLA